MLRRLATDKTGPTGVRVRLVLLLVYLASPIDLIPDAVGRHWPGTPEGLHLIQQLAGTQSL